MTKGQERLFQLSVDINTAKDKLKDIEKELKALEIIKKYIVMNRTFDDLIKGNKEVILIEIKALIPKEEYQLIKETLCNT